MKFQRALPSRVVFVSTVSALALIAVACGPGSESATPTAFPEPTLNSVTPPENFQTPIPSPEVATDPLPETVFAETPISNSFEKPTETVDITFDGLEAIVARRFQSQYGWFTDFNQRIVDLSEISSLLPRESEMSPPGGHRLLQKKRTECCRHCHIQRTADCHTNE